MIKKAIIISSVSLLTFAINTAQAGWQDMLGGAADELSKNVELTEVSNTLLSNSEMVNGLKEALANGVESAINTLGKKDGFMSDQLVKIPLPSTLQLIESNARKLGQGQYIDQFVGTMNHAAEQAVPEAASLLAEAIREMSVADATNIINGSDDAATQYFRQTSQAELAQMFKPIIQQATSQFGVTAAYKALMAQVSPVEGSLGLAGSLLGGVMGNDALDVDQYVTNKALDGLFKYIALEEKSIRQNPAARTTELLKKVFSGQ